MPWPGSKKKRLVIRKCLLSLRCHRITMVQPAESRQGLNVASTLRGARYGELELESQARPCSKQHPSGTIHLLRSASGPALFAKPLGCGSRWDFHALATGWLGRLKRRQPFNSSEPPPGPSAAGTPFARPVSSARCSAVVQPSSEPCPSSGLKTLPDLDPRHLPRCAAIAATPPRQAERKRVRRSPAGSACRRAGKPGTI